MRPYAYWPLGQRKLFQDGLRIPFFNSKIILGLSVVLLISLGSCAGSKRATYEEQRRGLLMLEGEHVYKNKGFYNSKKNKKRRKKIKKAHKKKYKRYGHHPGEGDVPGPVGEVPGLEREVPGRGDGTFSSL